MMHGTTFGENETRPYQHKHRLYYLCSYIDKKSLYSMSYQRDDIKRLIEKNCFRNLVIFTEGCRR